jgi:hypothetical protein
LQSGLQLDSRFSVSLCSSFYGDFENFDEDDDEDEEEDDEDEGDYDDLDDRSVADFRTRMSTLFGEEGGGEEASSSVDELISFAVSRGKDREDPEDWARPVDTLSPGCLLLANPAKFCSDFGEERSHPSTKLLSKFGLTLPPPADLGPDRRADLLPVLVVTDYDGERNGARAVLLNRRTGYLLGDLEQQPQDGSGQPTPLLEKFCIQPLWFGGVDNVSAGLDILHLCPTVKGAKRLTDDGLYWGGDPAQAQDAMDDPALDRVFTGFDFKFFVQCTTFGPGELQRSIDNGTFYAAAVSKNVLFKSRDRMGTRRAKPLWTEIMELLDGEYMKVRQQLYEDEESDEQAYS